MKPIALLLGTLCCGFACHAYAVNQPNLIFILADDLGYGDVGCYGQKLIQTPNLDRMAAEGMKFTRFYAGSTICAPSRCVLMTGLHTGRCQIRGNGKNDLKADAFTVADLFKNAGYTTALIGKWGLGNTLDSTGHPNRQGFDYFLGYLNQGHAHNHYPDHLFRNGERIAMPNQCVRIGSRGGGYATNRVVFAGDLFAQEALDFIRANRQQPFFLYLSLVVPHANNERTRALGDGQPVPDYGPYADEPWPTQNKGYAAMITRMDGDVGRILKALKRFGIARNTLVIFSSDNGPHKEGGQDMTLFNSNGDLRGIKRDLTEGGIRVPTIAWWPGKIKAGTVTGHVGYFGDLMATAADLTGQPIPPNLNSLSFMPTLLGESGQREHEVLYWEHHEGGSKQAVLLDGRWKGLRRVGQATEIYDLRKDIGEANNLADSRPDLVARVETSLKKERIENPDWPLEARHR